MPARPTEVSETLRQNLQRFRELRELTQSQLGARAGIAPASVSHFETGQRVPSLESLLRLADALEVSLDVLVGRARWGEPQGSLDPIFLRASRADAQTLETVRRVTAALLEGQPNEDDSDPSKGDR